MSKEQISRRDFVKGIAAGAASIATLGVLQACEYSTQKGISAAESAPAAGGTYIPGTYSAEALGMGTVVVTMTFDENSITDVQLDVSHETDTIGQAAAQTLIDQLLEKQTVEIDGVTGATVTAGAVKKAAAECIAQAKGLSSGGGSSVDIGELPEVITARELKASSCELGEITGAVDGGEYDVIVIGAGTAGVPCAVKACQDGAQVLLLQKEPNVVAQGNTCTGIVLAESDDAAVMHFLQETAANCSWRNDWEQAKVYAYNSGEAVQWYYDEAHASGYPATIAPGKTEYAVREAMVSAIRPIV